MRNQLLATGVLASILLTGLPSTAYGVNGGACNRPYDVSVDPADFETPAGAPNAIDNAYFPLVPGTTAVFEGFKEEAEMRNVVTVSFDTRQIVGVTATIVRDTAYEDGIKAEDTFDWYAQDDAGNVWYMGEDTREFDEDGNIVSTEGSWEAGVDGALPGIIMLAQPRPGTTYRQEYGFVAVDMATVINRHRHMDVPYGSFEDVVETKEFSCIEHTLDHKFYAPGVGLIAEVAVANGRERISLISVTP
jgi:hypothetical protein